MGHHDISVMLWALEVVEGWFPKSGFGVELTGMVFTAPFARPGDQDHSFWLQVPDLLVNSP